MQRMHSNIEANGNPQLRSVPPIRESIITELVAKGEIDKAAQYAKHNMGMEGAIKVYEDAAEYILSHVSRYGGNVNDSLKDASKWYETAAKLVDTESANKTSDPRAIYLRGKEVALLEAIRR
jgi:hypothetical protein